MSRRPRPECFYCHKPRFARGLCWKHHAQHQRAGTLDINHAEAAQRQRVAEKRQLEREIAAAYLDRMLAAAEESETVPAGLAAWILAQPSRVVVPTRDFDPGREAA